jgi:hypothetical protein
MNRLITLTNERLDRSKTPQGGYKKKQLDLIGISWPPIKGWKEQVLDTKIPLASFIEFVELSGNDEYLSEIKSKLHPLDL